MRDLCVIRNAVRADDGAYAMVFAVLMVVLLGLGAFTVDAGSLYAERRTLQGAADAGALAGVQELPGSPSTAAGMSNDYAGRNVAGIGIPDPQITSQVIGNDTVQCSVQHIDRELWFARFLGHNTTSVGARAIAKVQSPSAYSAGVMPFGIMSCDPSGTAPFGYSFGQSVRLKQPSQQGEAGNFQFLSLTDPPGEHDGAVDITRALSGGGVPNPVYLNTNYFTKTGINGTTVSRSLGSWIGGDDCTFSEVAQMADDGLVELLQADCPRLIVCPIIVFPGPPVTFNWSDIEGSKLVRVIGFSYFFVEAIGTTGNDCWVDGRFVRPIGPETDVMEWGAVDPLGAIGYRLVE